MRSTTTSTDQTVLLHGVASSTDAHQKRLLEAEEEGHQTKRRKLEYTTDQLSETGTRFYPGTVPLHPIIIQTLWDDAGHTMSAFLGLYQGMLKLQNVQTSFNNEEARKKAIHEAQEARKKALHDSALSRAAALGDAVLANEKARGNHVRDAEILRAPVHRRRP